MQGILFPDQESNLCPPAVEVLTAPLHLICKIFIETTGFKLSNVKLDDLVSDLGVLCLLLAFRKLWQAHGFACN